MTTKTTSQTRGRQQPAPTRVVGGRKSKKGQEVWFVTTDGRPATIVTSSTSAAAMDEAVEVYATALKRLAKR